MIRTHSGRRIGEALDARTVRVPDQPVAMCEVGRIAHRNHLVVEEQEVPHPAGHHAGEIDEHRGVNDPRDQYEREY